MKRIIILLSALFVSASALLAQDRPLSIALQGGFVGTGNEYTKDFFDAGRATEMITNEFGAAIGYDFSESFGARLAVSYGKNVGANPKLDQYTFQSLNAFVDCMYNLMGRECRLEPKVYLGVGCGKSGKFENIPASLKGKVSESNFSPAARVGVNLEFRLFSGIGLFIDGAVEGYSDAFNGLKGGRPFELRAVGSGGVAFHF